MRTKPLALVVGLGLLVGCATTETPTTETGGTTGAGGSTATGGASTGSGGTLVVTGGNSSAGARTGGTPNVTGGMPNATGGTPTATGGTSSATGGNAAGGTATGGASSGGTSSATGGKATGGTATGGAISGGTASGGKATGGNAIGGAAAGGSPTGGKATGGTATGGKATGGSATGGAATGGSATGGTGACSPTWNPPATANGNTNIPDGLTQVWNHSGATIVAANNIKIYQIMKNKGSLNYCVRWASDTAINATERQQMATLIGKCDKQWTDKLTGWGCWPYTDVTVKVVMWAVKSASVLTGWSDSEGKLVVNSDASCPADCGPWDPNKSFSSCSTVLYDEFFWLDGTLTSYTGWGSATGFYMAASYFLSAAKANANTETIVAHEMGHGHGLDDFYDWTPTGWSSFVMLAGSSNVVTDTDGWMLRDVWRHVRSKYGYPGP
jgi:hypothetical protein